MAGFGFLRQMAETFKYNRDLLGKTKREPFDNGHYKIKEGQKLDVGKELTLSERQEFINKATELNKSETRRHLLTLLLTIIVVTIIYFGFVPFVEFLLNL